jgi:ABC-type Na+ efflux pump permease subunit
MSRSAVALSRILLITRVLFLTPACILLFTTFANNPGSYSDFSSRNAFVVFALVVPLAYILLFSTLWYLYFSISRRVKQLSQAVSVRRGDRVDVSSS